MRRAISRKRSTAVVLVAIDATVRNLMAAERVPGLGVALIRDGRVVHLQAYGQRNVERKLSLDIDTVMYGASLTKATFAYFVMLCTK